MNHARGSFWLAGSAAALLCAAAAAAAADPGASAGDFAYRMEVSTQGEAAAYRVVLPLSVYQKIAHTDLSDLRVFNANGEQVPFAIERPMAGTVSNAAAALPLFPLKDDSSETFDAVRVTIESGRAAINLQSGVQPGRSGRINTYLVDGRSLDVSIAALRLEWPEDAADFAGRLRVEAGDSLGEWRLVAPASPVANLHSASQRLIEQRVEFPPTRAKYWRVSWVGVPAPFVFTSVFGEPAKQSVNAPHSSLAVTGVQNSPGEFEYDLGASLPVDRVNLELPDANSVVQVEVQSRADPANAWRPVRSSGFYRLKSDAGELRNGPVSVGLNTDRHWRLRTDPKSGGLGNGSPRLVVEWLPHEVVFVARGAGPFFVAYGSATAESAAVSLAMLPKDVSIMPATLSEPEPSGGEDRLRSPPSPYAWKSMLLWAVLVLGALLLAWMAYRLARDFSKS